MKRSVRTQLRKLSKGIDFTRERYYTVKHALTVRPTPTELLDNYESYSLLSYQVELNRMRIELFKLQRSVENLRLPTVEVVGLTGLSETLKGLSARLQKLTEEVEKVASIEPIRGALASFLEVADSLDRVLKFLKEKKDASEGILLGISGVRSQLLASLAKLGISPMEVKVGDEFNPLAHSAIGVVTDEGRKDGTIFEVHLQGYLIHGKVLRPAQVVVVKNA